MIESRFVNRTIKRPQICFLGYNTLMSFIKKYIDYLKDNPEGYWFKRRLFGWGWVPATWQGWVAILVYLVAILFFALTLDENSSDKEAIFTFLLPLVLLTGALINLAYRKGEKPKWSWGFPKENEKD